MPEHDDTPRPPREIAEAQAIETHYASRTRLGHIAARFRLALTELEYVTLELVSAEASHRLIQRAASGAGGDALPDLRLAAATAVTGRLSVPLAPYFATAEAVPGEAAARAEQLFSELAAGPDPQSGSARGNG